jgi:hypothetical protein
MAEIGWVVVSLSLFSRITMFVAFGCFVVHHVFYFFVVAIFAVFACMI